MAGRRLFAVGFFAASLAWAAALVVVPYAVAHDADAALTAPVAAAAYFSGQFICHQLPARSFHPWGVKMPVCARCFGLYASAPLGAGLSLALAFGLADPRRQASARGVRLLLAASALPTAAIVAVEWMGLAAPSSLTRFTAALPLGAAIAFVAASAIREEIR